jgi:hypothetical protein
VSGGAWRGFLSESVLHPQVPTKTKCGNREGCVMKLTGEIRKESKLHILVNNAGVSSGFGVS